MDTQTTEKKIVNDESNQSEENFDAKDPASLDDLDRDWNKLQEEWNELDQKQKQYLEELTPHELETTTQGPDETTPPVEDIENKLAEYESISKELESLHDNRAKTAATEPLLENAMSCEEPTQKKDEAITKIAKEIVPPRSILGSFTGLLKSKPPATPEKPLNSIKAEEQTPKGAVLEVASVKEEIKTETAVGLDEFPTPEENKPLKLKKKPGVMEKMRLLKYPVTVMVIDKIDGKKTLIQITDEIKVTPEETAKAMGILKKGGYI